MTQEKNAKKMSERGFGQRTKRQGNRDQPRMRFLMTEDSRLRADFEVVEHERSREAARIEETSRIERETGGVARLIGNAVVDLFIRTAGEEWVGRLRRREEAKTRVAEAIAAREVWEAKKRTRAGAAADTKQREKDLRHARDLEAFEKERSSRRLEERLAAVELLERESALAAEALAQEKERFRLRVCNEITDLVLGELHRAQREGDRLEITPQQIGEIVGEASLRAINAIENAALVRRGPADTAENLTAIRMPRVRAPNDAL